MKYMLTGMKIRATIKKIHGLDIVGSMFEDYGFAGKDERIWAKACPHEEYFQFDLTERQLAGFRRLNIPFDELSRGREAEEGDCGKILK